MRALAFTLTLIVALIALWASEHSAPNADLPVVHASATKQPAYPLFTICPLDRRNRPIALPNERTA